MTDITRKIINSEDETQVFELVEFLERTNLAKIAAEFESEELLEAMTKDGCYIIETPESRYVTGVQEAKKQEEFENKLEELRKKVINYRGNK